MAIIDEGAICFDFDDRHWQVERWDKSRVYADWIGKLNGRLTGNDGKERDEGTKAVDILGTLDGEQLYLFEVKDFRGFRIENRKRQMQELGLEIGLKVRDTLAGLVGAYTQHATHDWVDPCARALLARKHQVRVVAWIVDDPSRPTEPRGKRAARDSVRLKQIQQRLAWLTPRVLVADPLAGGVPEVTARNLPGAGQR